MNIPVALMNTTEYFIVITAANQIFMVFHFLAVVVIHLCFFLVGWCIGLNLVGGKGKKDRYQQNS
jgi:hypothetical protein